MDIKVIASGSKGNAYLISDGQTKVMIECGIGYRQIQKAIDFQASKLSGVLVSHEHMDHAYAVNAFCTSAVPVYMTAGTKSAMDIQSHMVRTIKSGKQFEIGSWTALPFQVEHDAIEPVGFLMQSGDEKLLYATDTYFIRYKFRGVTHLMIECNYSEDILNDNVAAGRVSKTLQERLYGSHMNLRRTKEFLLANEWDQLEEVHLLHLSDSNSDEEQFQKEVQEIVGVPVYVA